MLKQWAILIGFSAALATSAAAFAGGDDCAAKQNRAEKAAPAAEKSAAQSQSPAGEKNKQDMAANCPGGQCEK
jgi:hypothetical protein